MSFLNTKREEKEKGGGFGVVIEEWGACGGVTLKVSLWVFVHREEKRGGEGRGGEQGEFLCRYDSLSLVTFLLLWFGVLLATIDDH